MKAWITSIGEPTTDLCRWSLERLGFEVEVLESDSLLGNKLKWIYDHSDEDFLRIDADVVPNKNVLRLIKDQPNAWWVQGQVYDWYAQSVINGGVQVIRKVAIPFLRDEIYRHIRAERPETEMYRLEQFHNPRRCLSSEIVCGVHGWGQNDLDRVKETKLRRSQYENYDWELAERMI